MNSIRLKFRTIFRWFHIYYRIASLKELQISLGQPLINGRVGGDEEKNMADDGTGRQSHGFDFWIRFLADSFRNLSWLIQDDTNMKLFQNCAAKIKTQIAWLKTRKCHPWLHNPSTSMSLWEMSSFYFSIFELLNKRWFNFQNMSTTSNDINIVLNIMSL